MSVPFNLSMKFLSSVIQIFSLILTLCFFSRPRENKEIAATIMLRFAPDNRAPVDPVNKLRDYLKKDENLDILQVRLLVGKLTLLLSPNF